MQNEKKISHCKVRRRYVCIKRKKRGWGVNDVWKVGA